MGAGGDRILAEPALHAPESRSPEKFRSGAAAGDDHPLVFRQIRRRKRGGDALQPDYEKISP